MPDFHTPDDISKHYGRLIKDAGEDQARASELRLEQANQEAAFYRNAAQASQRSLWISQALEQHPEARSFAEMISGDTNEAIVASAKGIADRVKALQPQAGGSGGQAGTPPEDPRAGARQAYGTVVGGATGAPPTSAPNNDVIERERAVRDLLRRGNAVPQFQYQEFARDRIHSAVERARTNPSFRSDRTVN